MMKIKTVIMPIEYAERYDRAVNALLSEGWKLRQRGVLSAPGELSEAFNAATVKLLYAELERV